MYTFTRNVQGLDTASVREGVYSPCRLRRCPAHVRTPPSLLGVFMGKAHIRPFPPPPLPPPPRTYPHIPPSHTREMYELLFIFSVKVQNSHLHFPRSFSIQLLHVFMRVRWYPCRRYIHSNTYLHLLLHCLICKGHLQADLVH